VVGLTDSIDLFDFKAATLENPPEFVIWLGAGHRMNDPFYFRQAIQPGISLGKQRQRYQYALTPTFDLRKLDDQSIRLELETAQDNGRSGSEHERLSNQDKLLDGVFREFENLLFREAFEFQFTLGHGRGHFAERLF